MVEVGGGAPEWLTEIDLDPETPWLRMGTRQLGERPWLVIDANRDEELALKRRLCTERHDEVFAAQGDAVGPGREVLQLVSRQLEEHGLRGGAETAAGSVGRPSDLHPLDRAGRSVQEDLCLLRREEIGWVLAAASLCFPSRWRLADKIGRPLAEVHGPVQGYRSELAGRVDSLFDRLGERIVWRRNWFIHPDASLFQPDRPVAGDPTIPPEDCDRQLIVRSERQTLRTLPESRWVLFTIRIQQCAVGRLVEDPERRRSLVRFVDEVGHDDAAHRGISPDQLAALKTMLTQ